MFTGLVKDIGEIQTKMTNSSGVMFSLKTRLIKELNIDDSLAVNGVCQTIIKKEQDCVYFQSVKESLEKSNLSMLSIGNKVNLELALLATDRLGGHFVTGHVSATTQYSSKSKRGDNFLLGFKLNSKISPYIIEEGSICIDGVSLTVAKVEGNYFYTSVIPHTLENTIMCNYKLGSIVNIEVDILSKYMEKLLNKGSKLNQTFLKEHNF